MAEQGGDFLTDTKKYSHDFENEPSHRETKQYKFTYPSSMEAQIRKLKHSLDSWKEIILYLKKVFLWKKHWHPTALIGANTVLFMLLWLLDPSILTVVSIFGLCFTVCDYLVPSVASSFFKPEKWTARKDQELEEFCTNIVLYKAKMEFCWANYYKMKTTNRKMYFVVTTAVLSGLAWIGSTFNNLFLAYILVTLLLLLPGMEHNGLMKKWNQYVYSFLNEFIRQAKTKVGQDKKDS